MMHCFIDRDGVLLPTWSEAFPEAGVLSRDQLERLPTDESAILWCRCRSGDSVDQCLSLPRNEDSRILVLLADEPNDDLVQHALECGAAGCCNTYAAPDVLRQVALVVGHGGLWVGRSLLQRLVGGASRALQVQHERPPRLDWATVLSEREVEVARLVAGGASNKEVAEQLSITERTVKAHMSAILEKLGLRDRLQLSLRINGISG